MSYTDLNSMLFIYTDGNNMDSFAYNFDLSLDKIFKKNSKRKDFNIQIVNIVAEFDHFVYSISFQNSFAYKLRNNSTVWTAPKENDIKFKHNLHDWFSVNDPKDASIKTLLPNATS